MSQNLNTNPRQWFQKFVEAYIEGALWSSTDNQDASGGEPLDKNYDADDIDARTMSDFLADCANFMHDLFEPSNKITAEDRGRLDSEQSGHDFWLTRNKHGAGFWSRGELDEENLGNRLAAMCRPYGTYDLFVDDGKITGS